MPNNKFSALD